MNIEMLENLTFEIENLICKHIISYHKPEHFGATTCGNDIYLYDGDKNICWYGEYDMGYKLMVDINDDLRRDTCYDLIIIVVEFGKLKQNVDENIDKIDESTVDFIDMDDIDNYKLHISFYNKNNKIGTFDGLFNECMKTNKTDKE